MHMKQNLLALGLMGASLLASGTLTAQTTAPTDGFKVTFTTAKAAGQQITLAIDYTGEATPWLDLNGDGVFQDGENMPGREQETAFTIGATQELTAYGDFTAFTCSEQQITALDVTAAPHIEWLSCSTNEIQVLDVTKSYSLQSLFCYNNNIEVLDVTNCANLKSVYCNSNRITALDLTKTPFLKTVDCHENQITKLDLSNSPKIWKLYCSDNLLEDLNVSACKELYVLSCFGNKIPAAVFEQIAADLPDRDIKDYDGQLISPGTCYPVVATYAQMTNRCYRKAVQAMKDKNWDVKDSNENFFGGLAEPTDGKAVLTTANAADTELALKVRYNKTALTAWIDLNENQLYDNGEEILSEADTRKVIGKPSFTLYGDIDSLYCPAIKLTDIDLSQSLYLARLDCPGNELTRLDLSQNPGLVYIDCSNNKIASLTLPQDSEELLFVNCHRNQLKGEAMTAVVNTLFNRSLEDFGGTLVVAATEKERTTNVCLASDVEIAKGKNWSVLSIDADGKTAEYAGITGVNAPDAAQVAVYPNPAADYLYLSGLQANQEVQLLDLSGRTVAATVADAQGLATVELAAVPAGEYLVRTLNSVTKVLVK